MWAGVDGGWSTLGIVGEHDDRPSAQPWAGSRAPIGMPRCSRRPIPTRGNDNYFGAMGAADQDGDTMTNLEDWHE